MSADVFPRPYVVLSSGATLRSGNGYFVMTPQGSVTQNQMYAVGNVAGGVPANQAYAVLSNPASVTSEVAYGVYRHDEAVHTARGYVVLQTFYPPYEELNLEYPFSENRFPESVSYGSSGGPGFKTSVFEVDSGIAHTHAEWDRLRARYDVEFDRCPQADIEAVENFFYAMRGKGIGFRFKDWNDYQIVNQNVVIGDGNSVRFQLFKRYRSGGNIFDRMIRKPVRGSAASLFLDGVEQVLNRDYFINYSTGEITFRTPPAAGAVGNLPYVEFDVPVRFDTDQLTVSAEDFNQFSISNLEMIEILV